MTPPNGTSNPPTDPEYLDWEQRMAKLVGLEEQYQTPENSPTEPNDEPQIAQTQQQLSSNPFAKAALVGTGTLIMVMFAGIFLTQIMSGGAKKPKVQTLTAEVKPQPTVTPRVQKLETEVETLKTKLALAEQAKDVKAAQQQLRRLRSIPSSPNATQSPSTQAVASMKTPTPVKTVYREVERVVRVPQSQPSNQFPPPQPPVLNNPVPTVGITPAIPPTPPNPLDEWSRLAKIGSYGEVSGKQQSSVSNVTSTPPPIRDMEFRKPSSKPQSDDDEDEDRPISNVSQFSRRNNKSTVIGSSAKAVLATAIFGETSRTTSQSNRNRETSVDNNVFVVRLTEPLKTQNNDIALPKNTELLVKVNSFSQEGLAQLEITKVLIQENNQLRERSISANGLAIRGVNGKPLIASQYKNRGSSSVLQDTGLFVLGGLGKAAEIINRPESNVTTTANNTTVVTSDRNRDVFAGVLEGGMRTVIPEVTRRNQRSMNDIRNKRTNVWFLPAGTKVEVFVNQIMQF
jgi:outer membrane murein-binding lipoprotein Lpp